MSVTIRRVPIVSVGEWPVGRSDGGTGTVVTRDKLERAVLNAASGKYPRPAIGLGHGKDRKANGQNGTGSLGGLEGLTIAPNAAGVDTLYADLVAVPDWIPDRYQRRSAEWWETTDGEMVIHRLALLGDEYPAVDTLDDLEAIVSDEGPALLAAGAVLSSGAASPLPAPVVEEQPSPSGPEHNDVPEEPAMSVDLTVLRQSLRLPDDADEATINEALVASLAAAESGAAPEAPAESAATEPEPVAVAAAAEDGIVRIDAAALESLKADAAAGRKALDAQEDEARLVLVTAAADEGKFLDERIPHFVALHKADPQGTEALLASLSPVVPVGPMKGHAVSAAAAGGAPTDDDFYRAVYGEEG